MQLAELKGLMKENKIPGVGYLNKDEIIKKLIKYDVLPIDFNKPKIKEKRTSGRYQRV